MLPGAAGSSKGKEAAQSWRHPKRDRANTDSTKPTAKGRRRNDEEEDDLGMLVAKLALNTAQRNRYSDGGSAGQHQA